MTRMSPQQLLQDPLLYLKIGSPHSFDGLAFYLTESSPSDGMLKHRLQKPLRSAMPLEPLAIPPERLLPPFSARSPQHVSSQYYTLAQKPGGQAGQDLANQAGSPTEWITSLN
jgi:hypothetical protein